MKKFSSLSLILFIVTTFTLVSCGQTQTVTKDDSLTDQAAANLVKVFNKNSTKIPNQYIVVLKDSNSDPESVAKEHGASGAQFYKHALKGYTATLSDKQLDKVKKDTRVEFVSEDYEVTMFASQSIPTGINRIAATNNSNKGTGIGVAVLDTGIELTHPDLAANIVANTSCIVGKNTGLDDNGHGTHVAGTIAAINNSVGVVGVAPEAKLIAVKVLNASGSGTWSSIICGIDWITANAAKYNIKVANLSLGGTGTNDNNCGKTNNDALHKAICRSRDAGITYVVAAGNNGTDAKSTVPASYDDAVITVSALADTDGKSGGTGYSTSYGKDDTFASFSNYGTVVDIGAPGVNISSTWKGGSYKIISGTSMATPHVAGAAALYIKSHAGSTWIQVRDGLKSAGEALNAGHTDPSGKHPEPIVKANSL